MQTLQAQTGYTSPSAGQPSGKTVELAPDVALACFTMKFARNEEVFVEEEEADFVYKVISGAVRAVRILSDGRRQISAFHLPGDVFGLECGELHRQSAEAIVDSEIALVRRSAVERAAQADGSVARKLWKETAGICNACRTICFASAARPPWSGWRPSCSNCPTAATATAAWRCPWAGWISPTTSA